MNILVTGASGGIGKAVARSFAEKGYNVAVGYNNGEAEAKKLCEELCEKGFSVKAFRADVSDPKQVKRMFSDIKEAFGEVDVLVNNAGIAQQKLFTDITDEDFDRMFAVNVKGVFNCCREAVPGMVNRKEGKIINISSIWGISGASCEVHYSASKAAVIGLTKALAKELGPSGICVNCIAPGVIDTPMNSCFDGDVMRSLAEDTPLMRTGTPEDVAKAVMFLATEDSSFITGQTICVDGGFIV